MVGRVLEVGQRRVQLVGPVLLPRQGHHLPHRGVDVQDGPVGLLQERVDRGQKTGEIQVSHVTIALLGFSGTKVGQMSPDLYKAKKSRRADITFLLTYVERCLEGAVLLVLGALQVVVGHVRRHVEAVVEGALHPGRGAVAEVRQGHGHRDIDGGEQPEQDDGEEAADGEDDEGGAAVDDGADEEEEAEEGEEAEEPHRHRPPEGLQLRDSGGGGVSGRNWREIIGVWLISLVVVKVTIEIDSINDQG